MSDQCAMKYSQNQKPGAFQASLRAVVYLGTGLHRRRDQALGEGPSVEDRPNPAAVPRPAGDRAPGRLCRAAAEVATKYIIIDMYANAVQGMAAEEAVKWARDELVKVYA